MADDLQSWFRDMPYKLRRELAGRVRDIADDLADDIRAATPVKTGAMRDSVKVRRGRNELSLYVEAGGPATTKEVRKGSSAEYDYALATEFGTQKEPAKPFFYTTYNARKDDVAQQLQDAVADVVAKL